MFNDWFSLKVGRIMSMCIPVVPWRFDIEYPAELQTLCDATDDVDSKAVLGSN